MENRKNVNTLLNWWEADIEGLQEKLTITPKPKAERREKTGAEVREEIAERYRSHFSSTDLDNIRITHKGNSEEVLERAFGDSKEPMKLEIIILKPKKLKSTGYFPFKSSNISDFQNEIDFDSVPCMYFPNGKRIIEVKLPIGRKDFSLVLLHLKSIALQIKYLNPDIDHQLLNDWAVHFYTLKAKHIGPDFKSASIRIESIVEEVIDIPLKKIRPVHTKVNFIWNPDYELSQSEKSSVMREYTGAAQKNKTLTALINIYRKLEKPIQTEVVKASGKSRSTIERYWSQIIEAA